VRSEAVGICLGEDKLEAALAKGEWKIHKGDDGLDYYVRRKMKTGKRSA
jgi:hypothetical protein